MSDVGPFDALEMVRVVRCWDKAAQQRYGVTLAQVSVLQALQDRTMTMGELAAHELVTHSVINGIVSRCERRKLLTRSQDAEDGRRVVVSMTRRGETFLRAFCRTEGVVCG